MRLLVLYRGKGCCCGNCSTATHLCQMLADRFTTQRIEVNELPTSESPVFNSLRSTDLALGIHLFHAGQAILELHKAGVFFPFILIAGGTDVNEFHNDKDKKTLMSAAVSAASFVVCFSEQLRARCLDVFGTAVSPKLRTVKPGVDVILPNSRDVSLSIFRNKLPSFNYEKYVILVANLRPVKDVLYVVKKFSDFVVKHTFSVAMFIIGAPIDKEYAQSVMQEVNNLHAVHYLGSFSKAESHALINGAVALINSSISEGVSVAILEAMFLKTVVLARCIPGNTSVVNHMENGLIFSNPGEFSSLLHLILQDNKLRTRLVDQAFSFVKTHHSTDSEKAHYQNLCHEAISLPKF